MDTNLKNGGDSASGLASIALPGRKLATSETPRMLTPSEIALLQQDLKAALSVVGKDEIDDAQALLTDHGFTLDDFEFSQISDPSPAQIGPITGALTLKRKSTGATKEYRVGHNSRWLVHFEADLKARVFGQPEIAA